MAEELIGSNLIGTKGQNNLIQIIQKRKHKTYDKNTVTFTSDDTLRYFYFILSGRIKISQIHPESAKEQTLNILRRGDMFDVITLLDNKPHDYVATALESTEIVEVPIEHIRHLIDTDPSFNRLFFPYLARQMRHLEDLAVDLSLYDVYERLVRLLARNLDEDEQGQHLSLINDLSHEEIANLIGTVRKVLNRNLQKLKSEGVIDIKRKELSVKDLQKLFDKIESIS